MAGKRWAVISIWWEFLDERYFKPSEIQDYQVRLEILSGLQRSLTESFVAHKIEESENREIIEWGDEDAVNHLAEVLV